MQILQGIHRIEVPFGGRVIYQHLLVGNEKVVLVDTGIRDTPETAIFPYLEHIGKSTEDITEVVITHSDADHSGGNEAIKRSAPKARILCHLSDRRLIENPDLMVSERYNEFARDGVQYSEEVLQAMRDMMGQPVPVDGELVEGDTIEIEKGWTVMVHHVPGHSPGHLLLYDPRHNAAIITDAVLGRGIPDKEGNIAFAPTYRLTDSYLQTIDRIESLSPEYLFPSHFPLMQGDEVSSFLQASRAYVTKLEEAILNNLRAGEKTFIELLEQVNENIASWPAEAKGELAYSLAGGLESLEGRNKLHKVSKGERRAWKLAMS